VNQSTISRHITFLTPLIELATEEFRPSADEAAEAAEGAIALVDGTLWPCWSWAGERELWSGKYKTAADLMGLERFEVAMRPSVDGQTATPVTGMTLPLGQPVRDGVVLAQAARAQWGRARAEVETDLAAPETVANHAPVTIQASLTGGAIVYGPLLSDDGTAWLGTAVLLRAPGPDAARAVLTGGRYAVIEVHRWQFGGRAS